MKGWTIGVLSDEQRKSLELAVKSYATDVDYVLPYLAQRGIGKDTALSRGLGYVSSPTIPEHRNVRGRLAIPYITQFGPVGITFRCIEDHKCREIPKHSKYMNPSGQLQLLYGVQSILSDALDIVVVEGQIDEITVSDLCGIPSVGVPGSGVWHPWWTHILSDFRRVFCLTDGDESGEKLGRKVQKEMGSKAVVVPFPAGEDSNSTYLKHGSDAIREMIK